MYYLLLLFHLCTCHYPTWTDTINHVYPTDSAHEYSNHTDPSIASNHTDLSITSNHTEQPSNKIEHTSRQCNQSISHDTILDMHNQQRSKHGIPPLQWSLALSQSAKVIISCISLSLLASGLDSHFTRMSCSKSTTTILELFCW